VRHARVLSNVYGAGAAVKIVQTSPWRRAMFALFVLLRLHHIPQCDMHMRMFDIMVEPVVSYGAHIWGPPLCANILTNN
jgi:hypothetical protein